MTEQRGFWARQGQNLRQQFAIPRTPDGRIDFGRLALGVGAGLAGGPIGGMAARGLMDMDMSQISGGMRGIGTSIGRMFDGDPRTGFGNNPTAPWNTGRGPSNVPQGHPDFMGPPNPGGSRPVNPFLPSDYDQATSRGNWGSRPQQGSGQGMSRPPEQGGAGIGGRSLASLNAAMRYMQTAPTGWRGHGIPGRIGLGGNQNTGIGAFNGPTDIGNSRGEIQRHNYEN